MDKLDPIRLHNAGAIVGHKSPFEDLRTENNESELKKESPLFQMFRRTSGTTDKEDL